jgi:hypothetical protein
MNRLEKFSVIGLAGILYGFLLFSHPANAEPVSSLLFSHPAIVEPLGSITVEAKLSDGDRPSSWQMSYKIYQDLGNNPYREATDLPDNPFDITSLPLNHVYKIEIYSNGIPVGTDYVNLQTSHQDFTITVTRNVGMIMKVFYNDGISPIANAQVEIMTNKDNKTWANSSIDANGQSLHFYLAPTTDNYNYAINVEIGPHLSYYFSPFSDRSGDRIFNVVTPWPSKINSLLTVTLYNNRISHVTPSDGNFLLRVLDDKNNMVAQSEVDKRGQVHLSNLVVGYYKLQVINLGDNSIWGTNNFIIDGSKDTFILNQSTDAAKKSSIQSKTDRKSVV